MTDRRDRRRHPGGPPPPGAPECPPTVVSVEMDYSLVWPLVDRSPGVVGVHQLAPDDLGASTALTGRLRELARRWDLLARRWIDDAPGTPVSDREEAQWARDRLEAAHDLQHELGSDVEVLVDGVPLDQWHRRRRRPGG